MLLSASKEFWPLLLHRNNDAIEKTKRSAEVVCTVVAEKFAAVVRTTGQKSHV
jgi:hypothetical protein